MQWGDSSRGGFGYGGGRISYRHIATRSVFARLSLMRAHAYTSLVRSGICHKAWPACNGPLCIEGSGRGGRFYYQWEPLVKLVSSSASVIQRWQWFTMLLVACTESWRLLAPLQQWDSQLNVYSVTLSQEAKITGIRFPFFTRDVSDLSAFNGFVYDDGYHPGAGTKFIVIDYFNPRLRGS